MVKPPSFESLARRLINPTASVLPQHTLSPVPSPPISSTAHVANDVHIPGRYSQIVKKSDKKQTVSSSVEFSGLKPWKSGPTLSMQATRGNGSGMNSSDTPALLRKDALAETVREILSEEKQLYKTSAWTVSRIESDSKSLKVFWAPSKGLSIDLEQSLPDILSAQSGVLYKQVSLRAGLSSLPTRLVFVRDKDSLKKDALSIALDQAEAELASIDGVLSKSNK